jgi:ATP-dependent protease ClpP protease subunit
MAIQSELTDLFEYGIDLKSRRIYFGHMSADPDTATDFTVTSIEYIIRAMHKMVIDSATKPIDIYMNSFGGDIYSMLRLHDEIVTCPVQIRFFGGGAIMSSASFIMVACDERYLHINSTIMVHELSTANDGRHTDIQIGATEDRRLMERLYDIYTANSRMGREFWQDICQRDVYLTAQEAIDLGLADKLIEPKKRGNLRKMRHHNLKKTPDPKHMKHLISHIYGRIGRVKVPKLELNQFKKEESDPNIKVEVPIKEEAIVAAVIEEVKPT